MLSRDPISDELKDKYVLRLCSMTGDHTHEMWFLNASFLAGFFFFKKKTSLLLLHSCNFKHSVQVLKKASPA